MLIVKHTVNIYVIEMSIDINRIMTWHHLREIDNLERIGQSPITQVCIYNGISAARTALPTGRSSRHAPVKVDGARL